MTSNLPPSWTAEALRRSLPDFARALMAEGQGASTVRIRVGNAARFIDWLDGRYQPRGAARARRSLGPDERWTPALLEAEAASFEAACRASHLAERTVVIYKRSTSRFICWLRTGRVRDC